MISHSMLAGGIPKEDPPGKTGIVQLLARGENTIPEYKEEVAACIHDVIAFL